MTKILYYRKKQKMTQAELANMIDVSQSVVSLWETGEAMPRADKLPQLAKILNCSIEDLFDDKEVI